MTKRYDPLHTPDPEAWLALEEFERLRLVHAAHRHGTLEPPRARMHAAAHMVVENQVALGDETPVAETLERLMARASTATRRCTRSAAL